MTNEPSDQPRQSKRIVVRQFLSGDRTPMWFTLAMLLFGAGGTYVLAPRVNAQFEEHEDPV